MRGKGAEYTGAAYNACLTGDTLVKTIDGVREIKGLVGTHGFVFTEGAKYQPYKNVVSKGVKDIYEITLGSGLSIRATGDHKFMTDKGWVNVDNLEIKDHNVVINPTVNIHAVNDYDQEYEMYGWMHGDGWYSETVGISFNSKDGDFDVKNRLLPEFHKQFGTGDRKPLKDDEVSLQIQTESKYAMDKCEELGFIKGRADSKQLPTKFYTWTMKQQISFIRGLLTADGFVYGNTGKQINLASTSKILAQQVQRFLASVGIQSRIHTTEFKTCERKPQHKLAIANQSAIEYYRIFGFSGSKKTEKFNDDCSAGNIRRSKSYDKIKSIKCVGYEEVFDIVEVNNTNSFYANGMLVHNCNLGSINMYNMVKSPFTKDATFDMPKFKSMVKLGITALDEILDYGLDAQPLKENAQAVIDYRAIGLGIFGLADMFVAMGVTYGSQESIALMEYIMETMLDTALVTSCSLAQTKGTFAKYNWEYIKESPLIRDCRGTALYDLIATHGLRNGSLLSIAPTGSIGTMVGLSGGVEPLYAVSYDRTTHALEKTGGTFKVFAKSVSDFMEARGINKDNPAVNDSFLKEFPYITVSHDISPTDRVKLQAVIQKYVDNAISSTVNLKNTATVNDVYEVYMMAWKSGCKGMTVFRDGCARTSILGKGKAKEVPVETPKLNHITPMKRKAIGTINGSTVTKHTSCSPNMYITINSQDGNITEVFTNTSTGCQSNINTITRMASLALRSGVKVDEVTKELRSNTCSACTVMKSKGAKGISISCGAAIAESIEEIYKGTQGTKTFTDSKEFTACPECQQMTMLASAKCPTCSNCGFSKCD